MADIPVWLRIGVGVFITVLGVAIIWGEPFILQFDLESIGFDNTTAGFSVGGIAIIDDNTTGFQLEEFIQHEAKHTWQYGVSAVLGFPIMYGASSFIGYMQYGDWDKAYDHNIFEIQAYNYEFWYRDNFLTDVELEVNF